MRHDPLRPYVFQAYYGNGVKAPKKPGDLAIEVRWATPEQRDLEADIAAAREDIDMVLRFETR